MVEKSKQTGLEGGVKTQHKGVQNRDSQELKEMHAGEGGEVAAALSTGWRQSPAHSKPSSPRQRGLSKSSRFPEALTSSSVTGAKEPFP